ncbi:MAG TPA: TetR/AcrR family transcriptional regulator [Mycobacteriales bacterium]|nr:TetR/AcrR family transcriptional regulator [Mycobacteriales bacterium]
MSAERLHGSVGEAGPPPGPAAGVSRKRTQTRERLLAAALDVFAERGLNGATVEEICERAGFTRGAFYSNYASKDELLVALYSRQSSRLLNAISRVVQAHADRVGDPAVPALSLPEVAVALLRAIPQDKRWFLVNSEFVLHAVRNPEVGAALVSQRAQVRRGVEDVLRASLAHTGRHSTVDLSMLVRWLVALHEGGLNQAYLEPDTLEPESVAMAAAPWLLGAVTEPGGVHQ